MPILYALGIQFSAAAEIGYVRDITNIGKPIHCMYFPHLHRSTLGQDIHMVVGAQMAMELKCPAALVPINVSFRSPPTLQLCLPYNFMRATRVVS